MRPTTSYQDNLCTYCGAECDKDTLVMQRGNMYCCFGCATLHELVKNPDITWSDEDISVEYKQYDLPEVFDQLVDYQNDKLYKIEVTAPDIHCSSCVTLLEDLPEITPFVLSSRVNFEDRKIIITADKQLPLSHLATLLEKIGYRPQFSVTDKVKRKEKNQQSTLLKKLAVAGFCFGNSMMFSMPHYLGLNLADDAFFTTLFKYLNVALSILILAYPAWSYFRTALEAIKHRKTHIDIPIALGIIAIWLWSLYEITTGLGFGYLDSMAGLVFFLLVGKWYQGKVYSRISFDRATHDFLPISVRKKDGQDITWERVGELLPGDVVLVKSGEVIPVNGTLLKGNAIIDYSFITGESTPENVEEGARLFIGGKQIGESIEVLLNEKPDTAKIWSAWKTPKKKDDDRRHWTELVSFYFTPAVIVIAVAAMVAWLFIDPSKALFVFSSVLIVACPCALALSTPFTFGSIQRFLGKHQLYLKSSELVEQLAGVNHIVFDKTGTLTDRSGMSVSTPVYALSSEEEEWVGAMVQQTTHPLSTRIHELLPSGTALINDFEEIEGQGIQGVINGQRIKIGSAHFVGALASSETSVYTAINEQVKAQFVFHNSYHKGLKQLLQELGSHFKLSIVSGDNDGEAQYLKSIYPHFESVKFNCSPEEKKAYINACDNKGDHTLMIGDGLNDQSALNESSIGLAVTPNIHGFYPSSDGILIADSLDKLPKFLALAGQSGNILKASLVFSVFYNLIGIAFAVTGSLSPIVAAILMPLSSITVVGLVTALVSLKAKRLQLI